MTTDFYDRLGRRIPAHEIERRRRQWRALAKKNRAKRGGYDFKNRNPAWPVCDQIKANGEKCNALALRDYPMCYAHSPPHIKAVARRQKQRRREQYNMRSREVTPRRYARRIRDDRLKADIRAAAEAIGRLWPGADGQPPEDVREAARDRAGAAYFDSTYKSWRTIMCAAVADHAAGRIGDAELDRVFREYGPEAHEWWKRGILAWAYEGGGTNLADLPYDPMPNLTDPVLRRRDEQREVKRRARKAERREESEATLAARRDIDKTLAELDAEARAAAESDREELAALGLADDDEEADGGPNR